MSEPGEAVEVDDSARPGAEKSPDAFRTISEVSVSLDVPQHVLRFWEGKFAQIRPLKRGGGRRYYRPDDVELLRGIQSLLYGDGYTIKGVQKLLRENGVKFVIAAGRRRTEQAKAKAAATPAPAASAPAAVSPTPPAVAASLAPEPAPRATAAPIVARAEPPPPAPSVAPAHPLEAPVPAAPAELANPTRREAAARLLSQLKSLRRDYDLALQAAKNGRKR